MTCVICGFPRKALLSSMRCFCKKGFPDWTLSSASICVHLRFAFFLRVHSRFKKVLAFVFPLTLPVMDRQGVPVWIKDGGHSAPGEIQRFDNKLGTCVFEFLDRLIEIGDF